MNYTSDKKGIDIQNTNKSIAKKGRDLKMDKRP